MKGVLCAKELPHHKPLQLAVRVQICVESFLLISYVVITAILTYTYSQHNCRTEGVN